METERLVLRPFTPDDFEALFAYRSRPDVARWLYWEPNTEDEARAALDFKLRSTAIRAEGDVLALAMVRKDTREMIGDFILQWVSEEHRSGEIGFIVHPDHQGHGYATEGGRVMLRIAFEDVGLHRVIAQTEARNMGSARVLEKLGMRREAYLIESEYVKGEWQSGLTYAILEREWRALGTSGG